MPGLPGSGRGAASSHAFHGGIRLQGTVGERIAAALLGLKGYRIVEQNVRVMTSKGLRVVDYIVERRGNTPQWR